MCQIKAVRGLSDENQRFTNGVLLTVTNPRRVNADKYKPQKSGRFSDGMICHSYVCSYLKTNRLLCTVNINCVVKRSNGGGRFTVAIG